MKTKHNILKTAIFNASEGTYELMKSFSLHQRINYRGLNSPYHMANNYPYRNWNDDKSHDARKKRYEWTCLEKGIRPYDYPENLWQQYLRECADEEHVVRCEAKTAWMYEH